MTERFNQPHASLHDAKKWLRGRFEDGASCPCCGQFVKLYRRKITSGMALGLIALYRHQQTVGWDEWCHIPTLMNDACPSNMGALLRFWTLIEPQGGEREDGSSRTGFYRITAHGFRFVRGEVRVPKYVYLYNQTPLNRHDERTVDIREALGDKFNYTELMEGR